MRIEKSWFFLQTGGNIYRFMLELGPLSIAWSK